MLYITFTTSQLEEIIALHNVEILRQDLIIKIQNVEQDLLTVHTELGSRLDKIVSNVTDMNKSINKCTQCHHSPAMTRKLRDVKVLIDRFETSLSYYITASANEDRIKALKTESYGIGNELSNITSEMALIANQKLQERTQKAIDDVRRAQRILIVTLFISFLIGLWIAARLTGNIINPVRELIGVSRKIAAGNLGCTTSYSDSTEFGELASSINDMSVSLKESNEKIVQHMKELRETQEQLVQAAKLAAIGELASNVAHEINNPLTSILGYAELIKDESDLETIMKDIAIIERESVRAREIVQQLLEFARKRPLEIGAVNVNNLLREVVALVGVQLKDASIKIREHYSELPVIKGDPNQMKQVFLNLLTNAVHAIAENSPERSKEIDIRTSNSERSVLVEISDTGHGISTEVLPQIFEPFFTTKHEKGTGLGLSITYKIIQSHKGKIDVESVEGRGTKFTISLPIYMAENADVPVSVTDRA